MNGILSRSWSDGAEGRVLASQEPGVFLPFTAPQLDGVRGRQVAGTVEYLLPNLSGGRGMYVAPWSMTREIGSPTLHDIALAKRLGALPLLTPATVRNAARAVALEGYAGRTASASAEKARTLMDQDARRLRQGLLTVLGFRAGLRPDDPLLHEDGRDTRLASRLGWSATELREVLDAIGAAFLPVGTPTAPRRARRLLALMRETLDLFRDERVRLEREASSRADSALAELLGRVSDELDRTIRQAEGFLDALDRSLADPGLLLDLFRSDAVAASAPSRALENLLDGWDRVCLLWQDAPTLTERHALIPLLGLWSASILALPVHAAGGPPPAPSHANKTPGRPLLLVERNERVRARELALDHDAN